MRAATVIVGAAAFSSCLIALAFLLSGNSSSSEQGAQRGRSPARQQAAETAGSSDSGEAETPSAGGLTQCGRGAASISVEGVSCTVGEEIHRTYQNGSHGTLAATDPETGESVTVKCAGTAPVICAGAGGVNVYFAPEG
jgi:hypothetical protein